MDYGSYLFIIHTRTTNKKTCLIHTYATTLDQWRHDNPDNIAQHHSNNYHFFTIRPSYSPKKMHPAPSNKGYILCNMAKTHRETHFRVFPIRDTTTKGNLEHQKKLPAATAATNVAPLATKAGRTKVKYSSRYLIQLKKLF